MDDLNMIKRLKPDFIHRDSRGELRQLVHKGYSQINVISSVKGSIRGGHFHKLNDEAFYIIYGKCEVEVENINGCKDKFIFTSGDMFRIEPFIIHGFKYLEDTLLVSMYSQGVELSEGKMDIYDHF